MISANERQVNPADLIIGMYVSNIDRPWLESPFAFQGFLIKSQEDIELIKQSCSYVFIDPNQGVCPTQIDACKFHHRAPAPKHELTLEALTKHSKEHNAPSADERMIARKIYAVLEKSFTKISTDVAAGAQLQITTLSTVLKPMIASVRTNPDAMLQCIMLNTRKATSATTAITTAVLATAIGHRIHLNEKELLLLATGAFLYDVGKLKLPQALLAQPRQFTAVEFKVMKSHVQEGVDLLNKGHGANPLIVAMAQHHHERFDGSGYPASLKGEDIPLFARIAAIVDCFAAIISHRSHATAMSPYHAALKLYEWRNADFDPKLVEQLIQVIGVYPIGALVELTSGEVAVVIAHNRAQRLRPVVALLLDANKHPRTTAAEVDLSQTDQSSHGAVVSIKKALPEGSYEIELGKVEL
jgi:HD-GYP domain-containing protein (c-di-GMP phosphodiesterase class II)